MTVPLPDIEGYTYIVLTAGPDTLPEHSTLDGVVMALPMGTPIGSGPLEPGKIKGVYGYPNGTNEHGMLRWVMSTSLPTQAKTFIHNLPDTGWLDPSHEETYRTMARALIERGVPMSDVGTLLTALHNASVANERMHASQ